MPELQEGEPMSAYQPKTGVPCSCRRGQQRDNCPTCEGTGMVIDFAAIRARNRVCVEARCVACGEVRSIGAGDVSMGDMPLCLKDGSPMVAMKARTR